MPFTLTKEYIHSITGPAAQGDFASFLAAMDENVHWVVNDPVYDSTSLAGTYNRQQWQDKIGGPLSAKLSDGLNMRIDELDIVGNKAILEASGFATQINGNPYNNRFCWIMIFDEESGKIVNVREYMNTALVREVMTNN